MGDPLHVIQHLYRWREREGERERERERERAVLLQTNKNNWPNGLWCQFSSKGP